MEEKKRPKKRLSEDERQNIRLSYAQGHSISELSR
jgi:hypothetical protein